MRTPLCDDEETSNSHGVASRSDVMFVFGDEDDSVGIRSYLILSPDMLSVRRRRRARCSLPPIVSITTATDLFYMELVPCRTFVGVNVDDDSPGCNNVVNNGGLHTHRCSPRNIVHAAHRRRYCGCLMKPVLSGPRSRTTE